MRNIDANFLEALVAAPQDGLIPRKFVSFKVKDRDSGALSYLNVWSGDEDITLNVTSGETGASVSRTYVGKGALQGVGEITLSSDMTVQQVDIELSQIADVDLAIVFEYDVRFAKVEVHEMAFDVDTRQPAAEPPCVFYGEVDGAPVNIPAVDGEGSISIKCVSDAITMLTRTNTAKSSYNQQKRRSGDEWGKYSNVVANWGIAWGEKD